MLEEADLQKEIETHLTKETILQAKVRSMFHMQNELNKLIDSTWYQGDKCDFNRASMIELAELMDHYGYKWWKKQEPNVEQCQLEVIDIAHFHISDLIKVALQNDQPFDNHVDTLIGGFEFKAMDKSPESIRTVIDQCIYLASAKNFSSNALGILMDCFDLQPEDLCNQYIVKNTLNIFRNKNGYKLGYYIKDWNGKEDNEVLMELYTALDPDSSSLAEDLYCMLEIAYKDVSEKTNLYI